MNSKEILDDLLGKLRGFARKAGRVATKQVLRLYYVLKDGDLTSSERLLVYAAIIYVVIPGDFIPRRIFKLFGLTDDAISIYYVYKKISNNLTPELEQKVEMKLDEWFGCKVELVK